MCNEALAAEEQVGYTSHMALRSLQVMEFRLSERFTFLEYLPVTRIRRCKSAPDLAAGLIALGAPTLRLSLSGMRFGTRRGGSAAPC